MSAEKMIFVNLPVADLAASRAFYQAVGFTNDPRFTDETAAAMRWSETILVMLLTHAKWKTFTTKPIVDARTTSHVMLAINLPNRQAVDKMTEAAGRSGGVSDCNPRQEYDFMYGRDFEDPDGHVWEPHWIDMAAVERMTSGASHNAG